MVTFLALSLRHRWEYRKGSMMLSRSIMVLCRYGSLPLAPTPFSQTADHPLRVRQTLISEMRKEDGFEIVRGALWDRWQYFIRYFFTPKNN